MGQYQGIGPVCQDPEKRSRRTRPVQAPAVDETVQRAIKGPRRDRPAETRGQHKRTPARRGGVRLMAACLRVGGRRRSLAAGVLDTSVKVSTGAAARESRVPDYEELEVEIKVQRALDGGRCGGRVHPAQAGYGGWGWDMGPGWASISAQLQTLRSFCVSSSPCMRRDRQRELSTGRMARVGQASSWLSWDNELSPPDISPTSHDIYYSK